MCAENPEEFDVKWNEFRQCYLVEDITFYTYMFDYYYPKREKWSKAWREVCNIIKANYNKFFLSNLSIIIGYSFSHK